MVNSELSTLILSLIAIIPGVKLVVSGQFLTGRVEPAYQRCETSWLYLFLRASPFAVLPTLGAVNLDWFNDHAASHTNSNMSIDWLSVGNPYHHRCYDPILATAEHDLARLAM